MTTVMARRFPSRAGCIRWNCRGDVGLLICGWARPDLVVLLEERLLVRDDSAGGHGGTGVVVLLA